MAHPMVQQLQFTRRRIPALPRRLELAGCLRPARTIELHQLDHRAFSIAREPGLRISGAGQSDSARSAKSLRIRQPTIGTDSLMICGQPGAK